LDAVIASLLGPLCCHANPDAPALLICTVHLPTSPGCRRCVLRIAAPYSECTALAADKNYFLNLK